MPTQNIQFNYLYRDAGNNKVYHSLVFSNNGSLELQQIQESIVAKLIEGEFFIPQKWNVPLINVYAHDADLDHDWYEFEGVECTEEVTSEGIDIKEFLSAASL